MRPQCCSGNLLPAACVAGSGHHPPRLRDLISAQVELGPGNSCWCPSGLVQRLSLTAEEVARRSGGCAPGSALQVPSMRGNLESYSYLPVPWIECAPAACERAAQVWFARVVQGSPPVRLLSAMALGTSRSRRSSPVLDERQGTRRAASLRTRSNDSSLRSIS